MPLFDAYVVVDWSAASSRRGGTSDCLWIAQGARRDAKPATVSPYSRTEATDLIRRLLVQAVRAGERVLVGADFAYGYPAGFAALLGEVDAPPWRAVWTYVSAHVKDDIGTRAGARPSNGNNRFEVAAAINAAVSSADAPGPFWCLPNKRRHPAIPQRRPAQPFLGTIASVRLADTLGGSDTPFRLFGTGSVGGQALTGIPRVASLRFDPDLAAHSVVWPFETEWASADGAWLGSEPRIVHAEIYPSARVPLDDTIKDRGQVRALWHWARDLDARDRLTAEFAIPPGLVAGSLEDEVVRSEEGWVLGIREGGRLALKRASGPRATKR